MSDMSETERRCSGKIDRLPLPIKAQVEDMLADNSISFTCISDWLKQQEFDISYGAVARYAKRMNRIAQRVAENLEQTKYILDRIERNPNIDPEKAAQAVMVDGLMQRISTADDDFYEMPLDKAGRLLASFRRVNVAEKKLAFEMRKKMELAFDNMELELSEAIKSDPVLFKEVQAVMQKARQQLFSED